MFKFFQLFTKRNALKITLGMFLLTTIITQVRGTSEEDREPLSVQASSSSQKLHYYTMKQLMDLRAANTALPLISPEVLAYLQKDGVMKAAAIKAITITSEKKDG